MKPRLALLWLALLPAAPCLGQTRPLQTEEAATARSDRIALNSRQTDETKWWAVLLLGLITQLSIGMVHLDRAPAHVAAVVVFALAAIVALGTVAVQEAPFDGPLRIPPEPLERVLRAVAT